MRLGKRGWLAVTVVLAVFAVAIAIRSAADEPAHEESSYGLGSLPFDVDGQPAIPADAREQLTWFADLGPETRPIRVVRASVTRARLAELSVVVAREVDGSSRVTLPASLPSLSRLLFFLRASGRDCTRLPPGTAELVRPRLSVLYEIGGRRVVKEVDYPAVTIMVPRTRPCS